MSKLKRKWALMVLAAFGGVMILSGCSSTKAYPSDCAFVVGNGVGDAREVKRVVHPGEKVSVKGDDEDFYVPCNARNFLITKPGVQAGDRHEPVTGTTAKPVVDNVVVGPGTPVKAYLRMYWTLNQDDNILGGEFWPFCRKYACASRSHDGGEDNVNFSTAGWNGMLSENHSLVLDSAFQQAIQNFTPEVWNDQAQWPKIATAMQPLFMSLMREADGSTDDFFCGTWTPADRSDPGTGKGKCTDVRITITDVQAPDAVQAAYNANIQLQQDSQNRIADLERQKNEVAAEKELAQARAALFDVPGYREQLAQQRIIEQLQACGAAGLKVCGSGTGVLINGG